jgi:Major Facilitator Superfamily
MLRHPPISSMPYCRFGGNARRNYEFHSRRCFPGSRRSNGGKSAASWLRCAMVRAARTVRRDQHIRQFVEGSARRSPLGTPIIFANLVVFLASMFWGWAGDRIGRRWAMIIPGLLGIPVAFCYMLSSNYWVIVISYVAQGACSEAAPAPRCRPT